MGSIGIPLYRMVTLRPVQQLCRSMFLSKRRRKWRLVEKSIDRIPTRWKLVIAGLIGSGTGLLILTMWRPGSTEEKSSSSNESIKLIPRIQLLGRMTSIQSMGDEKAREYCTSRSCSTVICSTIPKSLDPGQIASDFITREFEVQCPSTNKIEQLAFEACTFPNNTLKRNWLNTSLPIGKLTFDNCAMTEIKKGAFSSSIFTDLKILEIIKAKIKILKKWIFQELPNLKTLRIDDNIIHEAEYDLLQPVADSLEVLQLDGCFIDVRVLMNITNGSSLSKVKSTSMQRNVIGTISSEIFKSIPNVVSLYLGQSQIEYCQVDSFKTTRSLQLLDLNNNLLKNLPESIFATLLNKPDFSVSMIDNPWNCTCVFRWIQDMITNYPGALTEVPKCETPDRNARLYFSNAKFCDHTTTFPMIETTEDSPVDNEDEESKFLRFTCNNPESLETQMISKRKLFSTEEWKFPSRFQDFFAKPLEDGTVLVNLRILPLGVSLMWFKNPDDKDRSAASVTCVRNVKGPFLLTNLERGCSYTVCVLEQLDKAPSPFNCLAIRTDPLLWTDTWLTNEDKAVVLSVSITLIIIISIISVLSSFLVIRRNPSLLRGSKRVVMVRKRGVEALVLPQGVRVGQSEIQDNFGDKKWTRVSCRKNIPEPGYLTPLEIRKCTEDSSPRGPGRKDSKVSGVSSQYSGGSYVSGIEPSPTELAYWRKNGIVRSYSTCLEDEESEEPPPLPPHHPHPEVIPSLSLSIDTNRDNVSRTLCNDGNEIYHKNKIIKLIH